LFLQNISDKIEFEPIEIKDMINNKNNNSLKTNLNSNLINLKAVHNNNNLINLGKNEIQNLINKKDESDKNFNDLFNKINIEDKNYQNIENKFKDDESLVQKIESKLKNKFDVENNIDEYFNKTPIIKNNYINYFENSFGGNDSENKKVTPNINDILFKPTNIIIEKNQTEKQNDYSIDKFQNRKLINQNKKLKEENTILKSRNEKLSEKILQIEKEQKKKNNKESSLLQRIKKLENQLKQKNMLISKLSNRNNFNNIKKIKILSFFIRNKSSISQNKLFNNLKIKNVENIRFFPDYLKESEYENEELDNINTGENIDDQNEEKISNEFEEDEFDIINNEKEEEFEEEVEEPKKNINYNKKGSLKKNKSNKVFSSIINNIENNYKNLISNSNNNTININKFDYNKEKYNHSLPVSNKKKSKNYAKKSIYEFFEKSSNNKDMIPTNKNKNKNIVSKKNSANKYNQNYNINFYKNNCYNNNFVSLFQKEDDSKSKNNTINNVTYHGSKKDEKQKTSLIMSVLNDNLLGNMNFNFAKTNIGSNNSKNKDNKNSYK
jgi:hypothetical protein